MQRYDGLVFIGRFQPFHVGHEGVMRQALAQTERLIVLLGSANQSRTLKNPFTVLERQNMILSVFSAEERQKIVILAIDDVGDDARWVALVKQTVMQYLQGHALSDAAKIGVVGHFKDQSSYYLRLFAPWPLSIVQDDTGLSATPIRTQYWQGDLANIQGLAAPVHDFLRQFQQTAAYAALHAEAKDDAATK